MIKYYYRESLAKDLKQLDEFEPGCWIHGKALSDEEVTLLSEKFSLEAGHITDALDPFEVPRLEIEDNATYVFMRVPEKVGNAVETIPFMIALGEDFILTITLQDLKFLGKFQDGSYKVYTTHYIEFLVQVLSAVNAAYTRHIMDINRQVRAIRVRLERIEDRDIIKFVDFEQVLNDFISALIPMSLIFRSLLKTDAINRQEDNYDMFEDLLLANEQLIESAKTALKTIVNIRDAYSTIMTQDLNRVIKILTSLTIIVTIPTMISSLYGMNIRLPFERSPYAFYGVILVTVFSVLVFWVVFKKKRW
ncbi:magnesium transporter CorA family protein [Candidatus Falkowbacteria bacterium]|nr:magnesium transporter CorA family protein [Candidatus Falkowbacteria bacterium]